MGICFIAHERRETAATTYLVPAVVLLMPALFLGEVPTLSMLIGATLCLVGVFITRVCPTPSRS
ncbi:EamA family transporter [Corynebacterium flavescens]